MRKLILSIITVLFIGTGSLFLSGCDNNSSNSKQTEQAKQVKKDTDVHNGQLYACPMHPEVTGHKGDKCPKCGMKLTKPVKE